MKKKCSNCTHWIPYIDNGQCNLDSHYCECDDKCEKHNYDYVGVLLKNYGKMMTLHIHKENNLNYKKK